MNWKLFFIPLVLSFGLGLGVGLSYTTQLGNVRIAANATTLVSIVGLVAVWFKLCIDWRNEPALGFGIVTPPNNENTFFLEVKKIRGNKAIYECEGHLTTPEGIIKQCVSVWSFDSVRTRTISLTENIRLFRVEDKKFIHFASASSDEVYAQTKKRFSEVSVPYDEYYDKKLTVEIGGKSGKALKVTRKISDFIERYEVKKTCKQKLNDRIAQLHILRKKKT